MRVDPLIQLSRVVEDFLQTLAFASLALIGVAALIVAAVELRSRLHEPRSTIERFMPPQRRSARGL